MSTDSTAGHPDEGGRPLRGLTISLADWLRQVAVGAMTPELALTKLFFVHAELADRVDAPAPAFYETELDENNQAALAAYAEVRARLVDAFGDDWHSRRTATSVVDELARTLVDNNTEPDDEDDEGPDNDL